MPRFMTIVHVEESSLDHGEPSPEAQARMGALFEEITRAGVMVDTATLARTAQATRVVGSGGSVSYTDGPFTESKEVIGGYSILQAKDMAEAVEWTRRFVEIQSEWQEVTAEVREILDA
ncbi:YciI family protein [Actinocatenispora rupis]|uniref:Transcriptional regulator n=1 Tax=Actinocatenispora rupis TaxID=519421 RepID=A0A8J3J6E1_9ACTN|nr:YciI family protein [Actinocatenispora rupis]GID14963.1 transcriptional regulator [Actinocatenispora rupis]